MLGLSLKPDRIDHSNSPLKWPILLQHFNRSIANPIEFHAFNLLLFLTPDTLEIHKGLVLTSMLFWVFTFLWNRQHVIYFPPSLLCWWFTVLSIKCLLWEFAFKSDYLHNPRVLKNLPWEQHLSLSPLCLLLRRCVVWSLICFVLWTLKTWLVPMQHFRVWSGHIPFQLLPESWFRWALKN